MNELDSNQILAIEEFATGLKECFIQYKNNHHDAFSDIVLNYVISIINLHLQLAELKFERYDFNREKYHREEIASEVKSHTV